LPRPNRDGYELAHGDGRSIGRTDRGSPIRHGRVSNVPETVSFVTDLSLSQRARFLRFYREDTAKGTLPFQIPDWSVHGTPMLKADGTPLLKADGAPLLISRIWLCVFGEQLPKERPRGVEIRVSFNLLVMP